MNDEAFKVVKGAPILALPVLHRHLRVLRSARQPPRVDLEHVLEAAYSLFGVLEAALGCYILPLDAGDVPPRDPLDNDLIVESLVVVDRRLVLDPVKLISGWSSNKNATMHIPCILQLLEGLHILYLESDLRRFFHEAAQVLTLLPEVALVVGGRSLELELVDLERAGAFGNDLEGLPIVVEYKST